ncbi:MAG: hypothetical protein AAF125_05540 [Chloroflexota bacterium]
MRRDLMQLVQHARMMNDNTAQLSNISAVFWIEAITPDPTSTPHAGEVRGRFFETRKWDGC